MVKNPRLTGFKVIIILMLAITCNCFAQTRYYVTVNGSGILDGSSWANAFNNLQTALNLASSGDKIWVAKGTYFPSLGYDFDDDGTSDRREKVFNIPDGIKIFGGFSGVETSLDERSNFGNGEINETSLSGEILLDPNDPESDLFNCFHVIFFSSSVNNTTVLDGFTIKKGSSRGSSFPNNVGGGILNFGSPNIVNCTIINNSCSDNGGGIYNGCEENGSCNPTLTNCKITLNSAQNGGGAYNNGLNYISNPTFDHCIFNSNTALQDGGGLYNYSYDGGVCSPTMSECSINNNMSDNKGGGIYNYSDNGNSSSILTYCTIENNSTFFEGGGIYNESTNNGICNISLTNCLINENKAQNYNLVGSGGGIYNISTNNGICSPVFSYCTISHNIVDYHGGGISNNGVGGNCSPKLNNCILLGNSAEAGGGICNYSNNGTCSPNLMSCKLESNSVIKGGGIYNYSSNVGNTNPNLTNCIISGNYATEGGGIYNYSNIDNGTTNPIIINCTISGNSGSYGGGGFYNECPEGGSCNPVIKNSIIWNNKGSSIYNDPTVVTKISYSLIANSGGSSNWSTSIGVDEGNNIDVDPQFVTNLDLSTLPSSGGDFHLILESPAFGSGSPYTDLGVPTTDYDGNSRPLPSSDNNVDIGAYEYYSSQFNIAAVSIIGVRNSSAAWGDYDNDDDLDILLTGETDGGTAISKIYRNDGNDTFSEIPTSLIGVKNSSVAWADYDNDGDVDILLTGESDGGTAISKIYRNDGSDIFSEISTSLVGVKNSSVAWVDYDNDGDSDILLTGETNEGTAISKIYRNDGSDTFLEISTNLIGVKNSSVAWADYDNDGDMDILLTGLSSGLNRSYLYTNDGENSFSYTSNNLTGVSTSSVAWGDFNCDGFLDILLTGAISGVSGISKIYEQGENNNFYNLLSLTGIYNSAAAWGDYNNDGLPDIILTGNSGGGPISKIYKNTEGYMFAEQTSISIIGIISGSVKWGDYDNDGDLDLLLTGESESGAVTMIYRNNNNITNTLPTAPDNLVSSINGNEITLSWNKSTDSETPQNGLNYNLVIGTIPNGINTLSPMSDRSSGYRRVVNLGNTNHDTSWTIKGLAAGDYYWSVQTIDNTFAGSPFAEEQSFTISSLTGPHFTKVWSGNPYHPMNIYVTSAKLDGADLEAEDEIAVFDGDICVASAILNSPIPSGGYIPLIASTDDPTTAEVDGFVEGDTITFKIWDSGNSKEINRITAKYTQGTAKFESQGTALVDLEGIITITQNIELSAGWNLFSLMIEPGNPNLQQILNPLIDSDALVKVQDEAGNAIEELTGIGWINDIGNWSSTEGYYLKAIGDTTLTLTDPPVQLPLSIPLTNSWNIISYPVDTEQDAMEVLNDLITADQLVKVQDENGNAIEHLPDQVGWVNYIGNFKGDKGYYLKANTFTTLTIDEPTPSPIAKRTKKTKQNKTILKTTGGHFIPVYTGNAYLAMNIYVTSASLSDGGSLGVNDEIGIFDGDICVGTYVLTGPIDQLISMKASTDDPTTTEIDGFTPGHEISYRFWLSSESKEVTNYTAVYSAGVGIFSSQGTALLSFTGLLPVELVLFSAEKNNNQITLNWETATEVNNYGFEVQRQTSSNKPAIVYQANQQSSVKKQKWERIGFVQGNGNTNSMKRYQFVDNRLFGGNKFIYRLKQIDTDGKFSYTKEIEIEAIPKEYSLSQNYPNPFNPITSIEFQIVNPGLVTLKVYDILGNEVATILNKEFEPGYYKYQWNGSGIASGVYFYRIKSGNFSQVKKMILIK